MNLDDLIGLLILLIYMAAFFRRAKKPGEEQPKGKEEKPRPGNLPRIISWLDSRLGKMAAKGRGAEKAPPPSADARQKKEREDAARNGAKEKGESPVKERPVSFLELLLYEEPETPPPEEKKEAPPLGGVPDGASPMKETAVTGEDEIPAVSGAPFPLKKEPAKEEFHPAGEKAIAGIIKRRHKPHYPAKELKKAIIWSEILGLPRALRKRRP